MMGNIRILNFSTHNEECGIAKYQEQFSAQLNLQGEVTSDFFSVSPNITKNLPKSEYNTVLRQFADELKKYDLLHIQHELSFYKHQELNDILKLARKMKKPTVVTVHTAPDAQMPSLKLGGHGPRSVMKYGVDAARKRKFLNVYVTPLNKAELILVHNSTTKNNLIKYGTNPNKVKTICIPVPEIEIKSSSKEIKDGLSKKDTDIIFCTVGFLSRTKGVIDAVKSLMYLPENYKLAIIGGMHPNSTDGALLDEITDLITKNSLKERVFITGYVAEDERLNSLIRECDICVYPFNKDYYNYVSSASLNNAFANSKPVVAYRTSPFEEIKGRDVINFTSAPNFHELAKTISKLDIKKAALASEKYAQEHSYPKEAEKLTLIYRELLAL